MVSNPVVSSWTKIFNKWYNEILKEFNPYYCGEITDLEHILGCHVSQSLVGVRLKFWVYYI